jgi:hypothetical protein
VKSLDGEMEVLSTELERLDYVLAQHGDYFCVRLPLLASVADTTFVR